MKIMVKALILTFYKNIPSSIFISKLYDFKILFKDNLATQKPFNFKLLIYSFSFHLLVLKASCGSAN